MTNQAYTLTLNKVGLDVQIWPLAKIASPETVSIGDSVIIDDFVFIMGGRSTAIGSFVHIASFASIAGGGDLVMEDFAGISSGVRLYTGNDDYKGSCLTGPTIPAPYRTPIRSFVHVGRHVIIGANSVILPGVRIGEGVAIGANSLVSKDCEPWTIYAGSPCRALGPREKARMLDLEAKLKRELYDHQGHYIPKSRRSRLP